MKAVLIVSSTIAGCNIGVENLNSGAGTTTITSSIVYANTTADLVGIGCPVFYYQEPLNVRDFIAALPPLPQAITLPPACSVWKAWP